MTARDIFDSVDGLDNTPRDIFVWSPQACWCLASCHQAILAFNKTKERNFREDIATISNHYRIGRCRIAIAGLALSLPQFSFCIHLLSPLSWKRVQKNWYTLREDNPGLSFFNERTNCGWYR